MAKSPPGISWKADDVVDADMHRFTFRMNSEKLKSSLKKNLFE